ncbi:MAG: hypothetical protein SOH81_08095 [Acetobacter sp.]|jgi:hypothetical protein
MKSLLLCALLDLTACVSTPEQARYVLMGQKRAELLSCLGVADLEEMRDGQEILVWKQAVKGPSITIPTLFSSPLSISTQGECRAIATVRDGVVTRIVYAGPARGLSGPNADCAPIVRGCVGR